MPLIDLSHTIEHGMTTYPGLPGPIICDFLSREASRSHYAPGVEFHIGKVEMVANTGTYLDSPFHRYATGKDLSQLPLDCLANLDAVVVQPREPGRMIGPAAMLGVRRSLGDLRGKVHTYNGIPLVVTYHPAALLRNPNWKKPTWDDVRIARQLLDR